MSRISMSFAELARSVKNFIRGSHRAELEDIRVCVRMRAHACIDKVCISVHNDL